ncbi:MAG: hypothetical protein LZF60_180012 [Nitrospira sp.]|nr:hypothetical protein [Nitrospira sp.]ULA60013.1 MAG: hypothetical protein LZF60_180012 [Nitrospira sp.]
MPLIWCSISGHGYGHAAQVVPVLNALGRLVPNLKALLRTAVPAEFFEPRLTIPWELSSSQQDIGCIQNGPLTIDVAGTWSAHRAMHADWEKKIEAEAALIRQACPTLVLSDVSHLGVAAGAAAGIPTIGMCSLSWDLVLKPFVDPAEPAHAAIISQIREAYASADCFLRVAPGLAVTAFRQMRDVGPIAEPTEPQTAILRHAVGAKVSEKVVLVGFGGIALTSPPFDHMEAMHGFRFLFDGPVPHGLSRVSSLSAVGLPFKHILASVDLVLTKPGYGTTVESVALGIPLVYVRRYNFADEQSLVDYLERHGRGAELSLEAFHQGQWEPAIREALAQSPATPPPPLAGAHDAAGILHTYF